MESPVDQLLTVDRHPEAIAPVGVAHDDCIGLNLFYDGDVSVLRARRPG